jgi:hypothetical protein
MGWMGPLCRWPFPRLCGLPSAGFAGHVQATGRALSTSFAFLQSLPSRTLAGRPQSADTSHGLCFPSAHQGSKIHLPRALPARYGPPSGFGYPLDGFRPSIPCRFCFTPAALMGFYPSEPSPLERYPRRFRPKAPTYRFPCRCSRSPRRRAGPTGRGSWALTLSRVPRGQTGV